MTDYDDVSPYAWSGNVYHNRGGVNVGRVVGYVFSVPNECWGATADDNDLGVYVTKPYAMRAVERYMREQVARSADVLANIGGKQ